MAIIGDALRQAFMPKQEYESLREEDRAWIKLQRPTLMAIVALLCFVIFTCTIVSLKIVFPSNVLKRPFCSDVKLQPLPMYGKARDSDLFPGAFYLTDQETVDYYWMVVFIPSTLIFLVSSVYLVAGIFVAYSAPHRHGFLKVVENNYCTSRRGGVRCLSILNVVFAIIYGLLAIILGSSLLTLGSSCSVPLFWCYEISSWGLVILYAGTGYSLRRTIGEGEFGNRNNQGLEMLEANPLEFTPEVERRVNEGFKAWMGSSLLSSDEEDEPEFYNQVPNVIHTLSNRQTLGSIHFDIKPLMKHSSEPVMIHHRSREALPLVRAVTQKRKLSNFKNSLFGIMSAANTGDEGGASTIISPKNEGVGVVYPARVTISADASSSGKVVKLPTSLEELIGIGEKKLGIVATKVLTREGAEIDDISLIRDGDFLLLQET